MSKSPSLRRIQADVRELALDPSDRYYASPLEDDMFEWHFTIRGADGTDFEGGVYHGRILLPPEYPFKPPHIVFLTPSGRFETNTKVCLSFSAYHPELWQPAWGIRLILEALISFLPTPADGAIGALDWSSKERKRLAKDSTKFCCKSCGNCVNLLPKLDENKKGKKSQFAKEIEQLQRLQQFAEGNKNEEKGEKAKDKDSQDDNDEIEIVFSKGDDDNDEDEEEETTENEEEELQMPIEKAPNVSETSPAKNTTTSLGAAAVIEEDAKEEETPQSPQVQPQPEHTAEDLLVPPQAAHLSWMYDPVLNLMMVLFAVIIYLLVQKYEELSQELRELESQAATMD